MALSLGDIPFEDIRVTNEEFAFIKKTRETRSGIKILRKQLAVLCVSVESIGQTGAIATFCGKIANLYPDDLWQCAQVDQIIDSVSDINKLISPSIRERDPRGKKEMRKELSESILPGKIQFLENLLLDKEDRNFCVGNHLSIADLAV